MIHVKHPKVIPHPWITFVFPLKGGRSSHTDSWAHKEATNVRKVINLHYDMWGQLIEGREEAHQS
jgi:hypothetical protein